MLATSALTCLALAALAGQAGDRPPATGATASVMSAATLGALDTLDHRASNSVKDGQASVLDSAAAAVDEALQATEEPSAEPAEAQAPPAPPPPPTPVAGLNQTQMNNALKIVQTGQAMGLPPRAYVIAVATAMQESRLLNLASTRLPESYQYNPEGEGSDHDSVGLFQQRPSAGWGYISQLMDPAYAASAFYSVLVKVPGWDSMDLTWAAQTVQVSCCPYAYGQHEGVAQAVVDALLTPVP